MGTQLDSRFIYLRFEYGLTEAQLNDLVNKVIASNELLLAKSSNRDSLLYDLVVNKLTGTVKEAETTRETDKTSNRKEFDVLVVTHPNVIKAHGNEEFATYGRAKCISHYEGTTIDEWNNYILKRGCQNAVLDFMEQAKKDFPNGKVPAKKTIQRHIKKLVESDVPLMKVEKYNGKVYYKLLNCVEGHYYIRVPYAQMRELVIVTNGDMLRLYALVCSILQAKKCGYDKYHPITRKYLAECLGYSTNSERCLAEIGTMLTALCNLGHLERLETTEIDKENNTYKTKYSYRRTTLEEWKEAKNRGTIKK